jgi:hypothetical protein
VESPPVLHLYFMKFLNTWQMTILTIVSCAVSASGWYLMVRSSHDSHLERVLRGCVTCEAAENLAKSDFERGSYVLVQFGLPEMTSEITGEVLQKDHGIVQRYPGCAPIAEVECFTQKMYSLLQEKFGAEFYRKARAKASAIRAQQKRDG